MLGAAEHHAGVFQRPPDRFIGDPNAGLLGQIIDSALERPQGERQPEAPRAAAHGRHEFSFVRLGHRRRAARARGILSPFQPLGPIACEPAQPGGLAFADNAVNLGDLEPLFRCQ